MSVIRIASRYAKSLLDLAIEQNKLEEVVEDIKGFNQLLENRDLYLLLKSPIINAGKKSEIFKALFDGKFNEMTRAFLDIILRKGREAYLPEIASEFINQYKEHKGISSVHIKTATPMSDDVLEAIKKKLLASDVTAETLDITTEVDEDLIGGFIVKVGDQLVDASIAYKLKEMAKTITSN